MATTDPWDIPLFGDSDPVAPIQVPFNAQANALNTALTKGSFSPYDTLVDLQGDIGVAGQHATVTADPTTNLNGDYRWDGSQWIQNDAPSALVPVVLSSPYINQTYVLQTQRVGNLVHMHGRVSRPSGAVVNMGVIDAAHRPDVDQITTIVSQGGGSVAGTEFVASVPSATGIIQLTPLSGGPAWTSTTWIFFNMWWVCTK